MNQRLNVVNLVYCIYGPSKRILWTNQDINNIVIVHIMCQTRLHSVCYSMNTHSNIQYMITLRRWTSAR